MPISPDGQRLYQRNLNAQGPRIDSVGRVVGWGPRDRRVRDTSAALVADRSPLLEVVPSDGSSIPFDAAAGSGSPVVGGTPATPATEHRASALHVRGLDPAASS